MFPKYSEEWLLTVTTSRLQQPTATPVKVYWLGQGDTLKRAKSPSPVLVGVAQKQIFLCKCWWLNIWRHGLFHLPGAILLHVAAAFIALLALDQKKKINKSGAASRKTWAQILQPLIPTYCAYLFKESHMSMSLASWFFNTPIRYEVCVRSWRGVVG